MRGTKSTFDLVNEFQSFSFGSFAAPPFGIGGGDHGGCTAAIFLPGRSDSCLDTVAPSGRLGNGWRLLRIEVANGRAARLVATQRGRNGEKDLVGRRWIRSFGADDGRVGIYKFLLAMFWRMRKSRCSESSRGPFSCLLPKVTASRTVTDRGRRCPTSPQSLAYRQSGRSEK